MGVAMDTVSSRELKNRCAEVLRRVRRGERIMVTNRGKPVAVIIPAAEARAEGDPVPVLEEAWADIETALEKSVPEHDSWKEALDRSRRRT